MILKPGPKLFTRSAKILAALAVALAAAPACTWQPPHPEAPVATRLEAKHLPNAVQLHNRVITGGEPQGAEGFQELQALHVRTIISVDGAPPNVAMARAYGLRYVHLPHGYNGISSARQLELAQAVRNLPGPIYIHCHHGKHRSPTAGAVACVGAGMLAPEQATEVLKLAGTSENYRGLYAVAAEARRFNDQELINLRAKFPETTPPPPLAAAMVALERANDRLQVLASAASATASANFNPAHEALMMREIFTELARTENVRSRPPHFQELLREGEAAAGALEGLLRTQVNTGPLANAHVRGALERIAKNCTACHHAFRDAPPTPAREN